MKPTKNKVGRPPVPDEEKRIKIGVSVAKKTHDDARVHVNKLGISLSAFVEMLLREEISKAII